MNISDIRIKLPSERRSAGKLLAYCSIVIDDAILIHDIRLIDNRNRYLVSMPNCKLTAHCRECGAKNPLDANFCGRCGDRLPCSPIPEDGNGRIDIFRDVVHPINGEAREAIQSAIVGAYRREIEIEANQNRESRS